MPTYTVFELSESDVPIADHRTADQAFALICDLAGFKPCWTREGFVTTLELRDKVGAREVAPTSLTDPDPAHARRELMKQAIANGIWEFYAVPDAEYRREIERAQTFASEQRRKLQKALREKVVPIHLLQGEADDEPVWNGNRESRA
jgi:hypothetical protein